MELLDFWFSLFHNYPSLAILWSKQRRPHCMVNCACTWLRNYVYMCIAWRIKPWCIVYWTSMIATLTLSSNCSAFIEFPDSSKFYQLSNRAIFSKHPVWYLAQYVELHEILQLKNGMLPYYWPTTRYYWTCFENVINNVVCVFLTLCWVVTTSSIMSSVRFSWLSARR